ncbi:hypothetical protein P9214_14435, partial [Heyndrickxia coagulans]|uniref:hypothetical protein n=1 Tax=Heyndrickxia coagulans TaxID=1398 RepID=UPI002E24573C|nr:hypothetical protein [Heyndrickxia coagulans]
EFLSTPYFCIIFACFPLFLGGKFFYPFFKPLGYKESVTSQLPQNLLKPSMMRSFVRVVEENSESTVSITRPFTSNTGPFVYPSCAEGARIVEKPFH